MDLEVLRYSDTDNKALKIPAPSFVHHKADRERFIYRAFPVLRAIVGQSLLALVLNMGSC